MKYEVNFRNFESGATSPIDVIDTEEGYTAQMYIQHCKENADPEWIEMLEKGEVKLVPIEDAPSRIKKHKR